jgi:hypothetical protein
LNLAKGMMRGERKGNYRGIRVRQDIIVLAVHMVAVTDGNSYLSKTRVEAHRHAETGDETGYWSGRLVSASYQMES